VGHSLKKIFVALYLMTFLILNTGFFNLNFFKNSTPAPTPLKVFRTLPQGSSPDLDGRGSGRVFIRANPGTALEAMKVSDGTAAGTTPYLSWLASLPADGEFLGEFFGLSYFFSNSTQSVWRTDGTFLGTLAVTPNNTVDHAPTLYTITAGGTNYVYWPNWDPATFDMQMAQTDGTLAGTHFVNYPAGTWYSDVSGNAGDKWVLIDASASDVQIYTYDFTTHSFSGVVTTLTGFDYPGDEVYSNGDKLFFSGHVSGVGYYMFATDGTSAGTYQLESFPMMTGTLRYVTTAGNGDEIFLGQPTGGGGGTYRFYKTTGSAVGDWTLIGDTGLHLSSKAWSVDFVAQLATKTVVRFYVYNETSTAASNPIWVTDGTAGGTSLLASIAINSPASATSFMGSLLEPIVFGGSLYFQGYDATAGTELWKYDGTAAPARLVDLDSAATNSIVSFGFNVKPVAANTYFVFPAKSTANGMELYRSDGTAAGTYELKDIYPGVSNGLPKYRAVSLNDQVLFAADNYTNGAELWVTDGTSVGTQLLSTFHQYPGSSELTEMKPIGTKMYFRAKDDTHGIEPWVTDGTNSGTILLKDIVSGSTGSSPKGFSEVTNGVVFATNGGGGTDPDYEELWLTNGTTAGTSLLSADTIIDFSIAVSIGGSAYYVGIDSNGQELWKTDGSGGGTSMVKNMNGGSNGFDWYVDWMRAFNGLLIFAPTNSGMTYFENPWVSDGTSAGTQQLMEIANNAFEGSYPYGGVSANGLFFFAAEDSNYFKNLYATNGAPGGTNLVKEVNPVDGDSDIQFLGGIGTQVVFAANDGTNGFELWASDGSLGGTTMIKEFSAGAGSSMFGTKGAQDANFVYFLVKPDGGNWELWKTDGTGPGTAQIFVSAATDYVSLPSEMIEAGGYLFFPFCTVAKGCEMWRSDKTGAGTRLYWDANPGASSTSPYALTEFQGDLYFFGTHNYTKALWKTGFNSH